MPAQSSNAAALRADAHRMQVYLTPMVDVSNPVLVGTVSADADLVSEITIAYTTTSGSSSNVRRGMRVGVYSSGGAFKGVLSVRFAGTINSTSLPVREFSEGHVQVVTGDIIRVFNDFVLTDRLVAATETFDPDYETYSAQNGTVKPVACSGGNWCGWVDSGQTYATVTLNGSESYTVDEDSSGSMTHLWTLPSGVSFAPGSASSDVSPTVRVTAGYHLIEHTVTDSSNSQSEVGYVGVYAHDATRLPYELTLDSPIQGDPARGFNLSVSVYENASLTSLPDLCPVIIWTRELLNGSAQSIGHKVSGRSHILTVGYLRRARVPITSQGDVVRFDVMSPLARLFELPGFSKVMDRNASPDAWSEIEALTIQRGIIQLARYYTNLPQLFDLIFDGFDDANYPALYLQKKTPGDQIIELADGRDARLTSDQTSRIEVQQRLSLTALSARSAVTTCYTFTADDIISAEVEQEGARTVETHKGRGYTAGVSTSDSQPVFAKWAASPGLGSVSPSTDRLIVDDAADMYERLAMRGAIEDRIFVDANGLQYFAPRVTLTLPGSYWGLFRFYREYYLLDLDETTNARGIDLTVFRFILESVDLEITADGAGQVRAVLQAATYGTGAVDDTPPDSSSMVEWPDLSFPTATIPIATTRSLIAYSGDTDPTKLFILARSSAQVAVATAITEGGTLIYTEVSTGLSGNGVVATADPFDYETYFVVTETGLYRGKPFASSFAGWTLVADNATMWGNASYYAGRMLMSINRRGWIYLASGANAQAYSTDYGATWTQVNAAAAGAGSGPYGCDVVVSPFNDGASAVGWLYKSVYVGSGLSALYKSTDWGATWSFVRNQASSWVCSRLNIPYKRGAAGSGADNVNDGSQWLYWQGGAGHSVNGATVYLSTDAGATFGTSIYVGGASGIKVPASSTSHTSIQTFTYDGDIIFSATLQTGAGGDAGGIQIRDITTITYDSGTQFSSSNQEVCVNGFSYGSQCCLAWSVTTSAIIYTYDGGITLHSANIPTFFTGSKLIAYVEWPLVDFAR